MGKKRAEKRVVAGEELAIDSLSPAQRQVMEVFWQFEEATVNQVLEQIQRDRPVARNTVLTQISRLVEKGWLTHRMEGREYVYSAAPSKNESAGHAITTLMNNVFGGSPEDLMLALLDQRGLSQKEAQRLRQLIDQAEKTDVKKRNATKRPKRKRGG